MVTDKQKLKEPNAGLPAQRSKRVRTTPASSMLKLDYCELRLTVNMTGHLVAKA